MPDDIQAQEKDIELIFRRLLSSADNTQRPSDVTQKQKAAVLILIVMEGLISLVAFYLLYLKAGGK
ncbi:MAG TPA: hypothetical protein VHZ55_02785 [Bryobacteraceae bacterium]|jgi:hypothetical protein|nr:hypothetical protein [Bryobacteraceae bacterium]